MLLHVIAFMQVSFL